MKRLMTAAVALAFVTGLAGSAAAQAPAAPPAEKKAERSADKPASATAEKKAAAKNASGTVKSASADSMTVAGKDKGKDAEWTFAVEPDTKIKKGDKEATVADLKAGDPVQVRYTEKDGKMVAQAVTVRAAKRAAASKKQ